MGRAIVSFFLALLFVGVLVGIGTEVYQSPVPGTHAGAILGSPASRGTTIRVTLPFA